MKQSVILIFVLMCTSLRAQKATAEFYANYWAGGVCCSQGMDMSITLSVNGSPGNCFDEVELQLNDGSVFRLKDTDFIHINSGDTLQVYRAGFGYSSSGREDDNVGTEKFSFNGPESMRAFRWNLGSENNTDALKIVLIRDRKTIPCDKLTIREDYTAYP